MREDYCVLQISSNKSNLQVGQIVDIPPHLGKLSPLYVCMRAAVIRKDNDTPDDHAVLYGIESDKTMLIPDHDLQTIPVFFNHK
jgi:hypothetical protein